MKKLCLAIAVGTAFAGAAQAQTKVETYGRLYPYFLSESNGSDKTNTMQTGNSNIGFRGNRDLGDGFKAGGQLEAGAYFDEGKDSSFAFDRNSFVYLDTPYGEVRLGSFDTVFKDFGDELGILGVSSGTPMSSSGVLRKAPFSGANSFHLRQKNSFMYATPEFGGFQAKIQYSGSLNSNVTSSAVLPDQTSLSVEKPALVSYGVSYENGPLRVTVASESHTDYFGISKGSLATASSLDRADEFAVSWQVTNQHKVAFDYNQKQYRTDGLAAGAMNTYKNSANMISVASRWTEKFRTAAHVATAGQGSCTNVGGSDCFTTGYNGNKVSLGGAYYLDKGTYVFFVVNQVTNGSRARYSNIGSSLSAVAGKDIQNTVAGINYSF